MDYLIGFSKALAASDTVVDFCRNVVHFEFSGLDIIGSELLWLDQNAQLRSVAKYGITHEFQEEQLSVWSDSVVAKALKTRTQLAQQWTPDKETAEIARHSPGSTMIKSIRVLPFHKNGTPMGVLVTTYSTHTEPGNIDALVLDSISQLGARYLEISGVGSFQKSKDLAAARSDELTPRQLRVLVFMSEGRTNAEIAREIMLSESAIRQETVKIYRALGVKSRTEASKKAIALGVIPKSQFFTQS